MSCEELISLSLLLLPVRHKTKDLVELIQNDEKLREERKKAKKNKDKYIGIPGESSRFGSYNYSKSFKLSCVLHIQSVTI